MQRVSWIPTVSGKLSYRLIGRIKTRYLDDKKSPITINEEIKSKDFKARRIIIYQDRYLGDEIIKRKGGWWTFYFIGQANIDIKEGTIFDNRRYADPTTMNSGAIKGLLYAVPLGSCINEILISIISNYNIKDSIENIINPFTEAFRASYDCEMNRFMSSFILRRNGIVTFDNLEIYGGDNNYDQLEDNLYNQLYFFCRDIIHKHKHHNENEDSILTCVKKDYNHEWKLKLIYSLYASITNNSRHKKREYTKMAVGILAYAKTLEYIMNVNTGHYGKNIEMSAKTNFDKQADVLQEEVAKSMKRITFAGIILTIIILMTTLLISSIEKNASTANIYLYENYKSINLIIWIAENFYRGYLFIVMIISILIYALINRISPINEYIHFIYIKLKRSLIHNRKVQLLLFSIGFSLTAFIAKRLLF